jgi:hypothetical protein
MKGTAYRYIYSEGYWVNLLSLFEHRGCMFVMMIMMLILSSFPVRVEVYEESTSEQNRISNKL